MVNYIQFPAEKYSNSIYGRNDTMGSNITFAGIGTSLSSNFYLRSFYTSNRTAGTASKRRQLTNSELTLADSMALRRAVKKLGTLEFSEENDADIRNAVKAYITTYNNAVTSTSHSGDRTLERTQKQLKSIAKEYASDLDKMGITVNDDGTLTRRDSLFSNASLSKFEKLFSKDSDFMQRTAACARKIERQSDNLILTEQTHKTQRTQKGAAAANDAGMTPAAAAAQPLSDGNGPDLDLLLNTGVGKNINLSL